VRKANVTAAAVACFLSACAGALPQQPPEQSQLRRRLADSVSGVVQAAGSKLEPAERSAIQERVLTLFTRPLERFEPAGPDEPLAAWYLDSVAQVLEADLATLDNLRNEAVYEFWSAKATAALPAANVPIHERLAVRREFEAILERVGQDISSHAAAAPTHTAVPPATDERIVAALRITRDSVAPWLTNYFCIEKVRKFNAASQSGELILAAMRSADIYSKPLADNEGFYISLLGFGNSLASAAIGDPRNASKSLDELVDGFAQNLLRFVAGTEAWRGDPGAFLQSQGRAARCSTYRITASELADAIKGQLLSQGTETQGRDPKAELPQLRQHIELWRSFAPADADGTLCAATRDALLRSMQAFAWSCPEPTRRPPNPALARLANAVVQARRGQASGRQSAPGESDMEAVLIAFAEAVAQRHQTVAGRPTDPEFQAHLDQAIEAVVRLRAGPLFGPLALSTQERPAQRARRVVDDFFREPDSFQASSVAPRLRAAAVGVLLLCVPAGDGDALYRQLADQMTRPGASPPPPQPHPDSAPARPQASAR
jgi:hypothetical protein